MTTLKSLPALRAVTICRAYRTIPYLASFLCNDAEILCIISIICQLVSLLNALGDLALYRKYLIKFKKKLFDAVNNHMLFSLLKLTNYSNVYRVLLSAGHRFILQVRLFVYIFVCMFIYLECSKWSHPLPFRLFPFRATRGLQTHPVLYPSTLTHAVTRGPCHFRKLTKTDPLITKGFPSGFH